MPRSLIFFSSSLQLSLHEPVTLHSLFLAGHLTHGISCINNTLCSVNNVGIHSRMADMERGDEALTAHLGNRHKRRHDLIT